MASISPQTKWLNMYFTKRKNKRKKYEQTI